MDKTLIAGAILALVSTGAMAAKPVKPEPAPDLTPRVEALEVHVGELDTRTQQLEIGLADTQQQLAELEALVNAIHGPTLPPTEPPVNPPAPEGGYAVYDFNSVFVGTTIDGSIVRINLDQYPELYFNVPAFEREVDGWANRTYADFVVFPDSLDCSTQPYLASLERFTVLAHDTTLLNPNPPINAQYGSIVQKALSANTYYLADPNNDAEAVNFTGQGSHRNENGDCGQIGSLSDLPILVPAQEVTIDIAYPLNVIFD